MNEEHVIDGLLTQNSDLQPLQSLLNVGVDI